MRRPARRRGLSAARARSPSRGGAPSRTMCQLPSSRSRAGRSPSTRRPAARRRRALGRRRRAAAGISASAARVGGSPEMLALDCITGPVTAASAASASESSADAQTERGAGAGPHARRKRRSRFASSTVSGPGQQRFDRRALATAELRRAPPSAPRGAKNMTAAGRSRGAALQLIQPPHRRLVFGIAAQPVDGVGRETPPPPRPSGSRSVAPRPRHVNHRLTDRSPRAASPPARCPPGPARLHAGEAGSAHQLGDLRACPAPTSRPSRSTRRRSEPA